MAKKSAGILVYREVSGHIEVLLVHPGGPLWATKDDGSWSIPKGEFEQGEEPISAARREFLEETGIDIGGDMAPLEPIKQRSGKTIYAWALEADLDPSKVRSNMFSMIWPPGTGRQQEFPEIDKAAWFEMRVAYSKISSGQAGFLSQLEAKLRGS